MSIETRCCRTLFRRALLVLGYLFCEDGCCVTGAVRCPFLSFCILRGQTLLIQPWLRGQIASVEMKTPLSVLSDFGHMEFMQALWLLRNKEPRSAVVITNTALAAAVPLRGATCGPRCPRCSTGHVRLHGRSGVHNSKYFSCGSATLCLAPAPMCQVPVRLG